MVRTCARTVDTRTSRWCRPEETFFLPCSVRGEAQPARRLYARGMVFHTATSHAPTSSKTIATVMVPKTLRGERETCEARCPRSSWADAGRPRSLSEGKARGPGAGLDRPTGIECAQMGRRRIPSVDDATAS
jgi:hypothetical protein